MAIFYDNTHTWRFESPSQTTSPHIITEAIGFVGYLAMDFSDTMPTGTTISSISATAVADVDNATEPTISSSAVGYDKQHALLVLNCGSATEATYTFSVTIATTDSQTIKRKGRLTLE